MIEKMSVMTQTVDKVKSLESDHVENTTAHWTKYANLNGIDCEQLWDEIFGYPEYRPTEHSYSLSILLEIMQWAQNLERNTN